MKRHLMVTDWKVQYYEDSCTPQSDLHIQCSPYQNSSGLFSFCRNAVTNSQIHMQLQGTLISQNNIEKEKVGGFILPDFKTY